MVRGADKGNIFLDDVDRIGFLERLGACVMETRCTVYAWALVDNHVHVLVRSGERGISTRMRRLLTWYAVYHNEDGRRDRRALTHVRNQRPLSSLRPPLILSDNGNTITTKDEETGVNVYKRER